MTAPVGAAWPGGGALATLPYTAAFDLDECVGQRQATFRFALTNGVTGEVLGDINPRRPAALSYDSTRTIKRQLSFQLTAADTAAVDALTDRIAPFMTVPGAANPARTDGDWPLGRYMFVDETSQQFTSGSLASDQLADEMFLVDQEMTRGLNGTDQPIAEVIFDALDELPVTALVDPTPYLSAESWGIGAWRGSALESLSVSGDFWSPWFDFINRLRFQRTFNPADRVPDVDLDRWPRVFEGSILNSSDLLTAPNVFVVISNAAADPSAPVVGTAQIPPSAPNSIVNRGFAIPEVVDLPVSDSIQAFAVAAGLANRQTVFERVNLSTPPDPRYDGYTVVRWRGANWLELAWNMPMIEGAAMTHMMRRSYGTT